MAITQKNLYRHSGNADNPLDLTKDAWIAAWAVLPGWSVERATRWFGECLWCGALEEAPAEPSEMHDPCPPRGVPEAAASGSHARVAALLLSERLAARMARESGAPYAERAFRGDAGALMDHEAETIRWLMRQIRQDPDTDIHPWIRKLIAALEGKL